MPDSRAYTLKKMLSWLRQGDFAHAGEEEAIEWVMGQYEKSAHQKILDVGCGLGGTAHYIQKQGWGKVTGFDIESEFVAHAIRHYPDVTFHHSDVCAVHAVFKPGAFDILYAFNAFYGFSNKPAALKALNVIAKTSARLAIFDYASTSTAQAFLPEAYDRQGSWNPIDRDEIGATLKASRWRLDARVDMTEQYILWYQDLVQKLEINKDFIIDEYGRQAYIHALSGYSEIYQALMEKKLGGIIVYAEKMT